MKKSVVLSAIFLSAGITLYSCGGGGGGDNGSLFGSDYVKLKSLTVENERGETNNPVINPGEKFYIKWKADHPETSIYHITFFALPTSYVPDKDEFSQYNRYKIAEDNCGFNSFLDCSKGIMCEYIKSVYDSQISYRIQCYTYNELFEGKWEPLNYYRPIDPYNINYIGANATVVSVDGNLEFSTVESKKAVPVIFNP